MHLDEAIGKNQRCRPEGRRYKGPACQGTRVLRPADARGREIPHMRRPTLSQERKRKKKSACCGMTVVGVWSDGRTAKRALQGRGTMARLTRRYRRRGADCRERSASDGGPYRRVGKGEFDAFAHGVDEFGAHTNLVAEMPLQELRGLPIHELALGAVGAAFRFGGL